MATQLLLSLLLLALAHPIHGFVVNSRPRSISFPSVVSSLPLASKSGNANAQQLQQPRLIVFDLDGCLWKPEMYELAWRGMGHAPFEFMNDNKTRMKSQLNSVVQLIGDVAELMDELVLDYHHPTATATIIPLLAISSRCDEPIWARELLSKMTLPRSGKTLQEAITGPWEISKDAKVHHFERISKQTGIPLKEMVFFDNESQNCKSVSRMGVTVGYTPQGVTRSIFEQTMARFPCEWGVVGLEV